MDREDDLEMLKQAKPFIRGVLAFILYARYTSVPVEASYTIADGFIAQLEKDLRA